MKRTLMIGVLILAACCAAAGQRGGARQAPANEAYPPVAKTEAEKRILATLDEAVKVGELYANVPARDGRMLRLLAEAVNAKNVVEIGTSTGLSGMWFSLALRKTGGKLTTFELDPARAKMARTHFEKAGVAGMITIVEGDAHSNVTRLKEPIDVVFIDADKEGYVDYLNKLLPLVRPGGLILAHNSDMVPEYMKIVSTSPDLETVLLTPTGGLAMTLKKR